MKFGKHYLNEQRKKRIFALWPITIGPETRWLEWVEYMEEWYCPFSGGWGWYKIKFLN